MDYRTLNPATEELVKSFNIHDATQINNCLENAWKGFLEWKNSNVQERKILLNAVAKELRSRKDECAAVMTLEMGKPINAGLSEVEKCASTCEYYAEKGAEFIQPETVEGIQKKAYVRFDPLGPILAIMPWNFPLWQVIRFSAPTLVLGNTVVLKHAPCTPQCALLIENIFKSAGAPQGTFQSHFFFQMNRLLK